MDEEFFDELRERVLPYFEDKDGHSFGHVERVYGLALRISKGEDVDLDIVRAAVLLHDVARSKEGVGENCVCHAEEGARMAREILVEVGFSEEKIDGVVHCIEVHRWSKGLKAESREAEILQDADRLDSLGAIIIPRMMKFIVAHDLKVHDPNEVPGEFPRKDGRSSLINYIYEKILKIKPESFNTEKAREIARGRYDFVKEFAERYVGEVEGRM